MRTACGRERAGMTSVLAAAERRQRTAAGTGDHEARISVLKEIGWGYDVMEQNGIVSPVTSVECRYRKPTTFPDEVDIELFVEEIRGARMKITYLMKNVKDETVCEASSEHVFMDGKGKLLRPDRDCPELYEALKSI